MIISPSKVVLLAILFFWFNESIAQSLDSVDYSSETNWAFLPSDSIYGPGNQLLIAKHDSVDVFFIYPTLLIDKKDKRWNYNIDDPKHRETVIDNIIPMQASAWGEAGNIYAPFYRQAHLKSFSDLENGGKKALLFAYADVRRAFQYYLDHYNNGNAIILAGHSQGSVMLSELIKEFFDGKPLQSKLIAAYLPGAGIEEQEYKNISLMTHPDSTGGFVTWNTFKKRYNHPNYLNWYKGKSVVNPITWSSVEVATKELHQGFYFTNGKVYKNCFDTHTIDGAIWITRPDFPFKSMSIMMKHYHIGDINLFWENIRSNALNRVDQYFMR